VVPIIGVPGCCVSDAQCKGIYAPCNVTSCNLANGACQSTPVNCDDGIPTTYDTCTNGICTHTSFGCTNNLQCDDSNNCTLDICNSVGACQNTLNCPSLFSSCKYPNTAYCGRTTGCQIGCCQDSDCVPTNACTDVVCQGYYCQQNFNTTRPGCQVLIILLQIKRISENTTQTKIDINKIVQCYQLLSLSTLLQSGLY